MQIQMQLQFERLWKKYFPGAELPLVFFYTDAAQDYVYEPPDQRQGCVICELAKARYGRDLILDAQSVRCSGGRRYLGFSQELRPDVEYFLSCGIPGELEGERYKKTPQLVKEHLRHQPPFEAPGKYLIFKRWDGLLEEDQPEVVVFFATPDVLSGLFTLANYDTPDPNAVIAPFGSGCASIVQYPLQEAQSENPCAVLGMFDASARPCVPSNVLTLAAPWSKFERMVANMEESFLITHSWEKVGSRIQRED